MNTAFRHIATETVGDICVVTLCDCMIEESSLIEELDAEFSALSNVPELRNVLVDFRRVQIFSSAAIGIFRRLFKRTSERNGTTMLCCVDPAIISLLRMTKDIPQKFKYYSNRADALAAFAQ